MKRASLGTALLLLLLPAPAATAAGKTPDRGWAGDLRGTAKPQPGTPVAGLPDARGRTFTTLDAYLAHLRAWAAPIDRPWWREVRPGVFRRETTMRGGRAERLWTRRELERRFGFAQAARR